MDLMSLNVKCFFYAYDWIENIVYLALLNHFPRSFLFSICKTVGSHNKLKDHILIVADMCYYYYRTYFAKASAVTF